MNPPKSATLQKLLSAPDSMPKKERLSRADRAAIRHVGYHEWVCGNSQGSAYGKGYEAGYRAAMALNAKRNLKLAQQVTRYTGT